MDMSTTLDRTVFQSSELSRQPLPVFAAATNGPVEITRRDDVSLVMMSKRESDARDRLLELAAQLIAITLEDDQRTLGMRMADRFDWMLALNDTDREQCAKELINAARASFSTKQAHLAIAELTAWRSTATAIAEGLTNDSIQWFEEFEPVQNP
jgi:dsDNA-binding SOS-regulon protein